VVKRENAASTTSTRRHRGSRHQPLGVPPPSDSSSLKIDPDQVWPFSRRPHGRPASPPTRRPDRCVATLCQRMPRGWQGLGCVCVGGGSLSLSFIGRLRHQSAGRAVEPEPGGNGRRCGRLLPASLHLDTCVEQRHFENASPDDSSSSFGWRWVVCVCVCVCVWLCRIVTVFRAALERLTCWRVLAVTLKRSQAVAVCFFLPPGPHNLSLLCPRQDVPRDRPCTQGAL